MVNEELVAEMARRIAYELEKRLVEAQADLELAPTERVPELRATVRSLGRLVKRLSKPLKAGRRVPSEPQARVLH